MYAIIETGGKQYKVKEGDVIFVEKLNAQTGTTHTFDKVLSCGDGDSLTFGTPYVTGASVAASVLGDIKGKKIVVYKYKSKKNYHRKKGHRQPYTQLKITGITAG
ncbi:MAG: 50S ribosomal protein L21 [Firmicutes bacterium]|nr:50S ribosomal protein L21 [Bacillota bacterium]